MNIFLYELKSYKKSTIIWTLSLTALMVFYLSIYPSFFNDASAVREMLSGYPESVRKAFGVSLDTITSFLGFYTFVFEYVVLCGAIQAMNLGLSMMSKEARMGTSDFLLTKPVNRTKIMTSKICAAVALLISTNIIYTISSVFMALAVSTEDFSIKTYVMISITMFFVQIIFMAVGFAAAVFFPRIRSTVSISLGTVFGFFIVSMLGSVVSDKAVSYITPFKYFDPLYIIRNSAYETIYVIISAAIIVLSAAASLTAYSLKDIHTV